MNISYLALLIAAVFFPLSCQAAGFDVRTGSWQMTTTTTMAGMMIPKEALDRMPPEQRARVQASMQAMAGKPNTHVSVECVTQQDLDRGQLSKSDDAKCTRKVIAQSPRHMELMQTCPAPESTKARIVFDAASATRYTASMDVTRAEGGQVHVTISGRWLSASCQKSDK